MSLELVILGLDGIILQLLARVDHFKPFTGYYMLNGSITPYPIKHRTGNIH